MIKGSKNNEFYKRSYLLYKNKKIISDNSMIFSYMIHSEECIEKLFLPTTVQIKRRLSKSHFSLCLYITYSLYQARKEYMPTQLPTDQKDRLMKANSHPFCNVILAYHSCIINQLHLGVINQKILSLYPCVK